VKLQFLSALTPRFRQPVTDLTVRWHDAALSRKMAMLMVLAVCGGCAVGLLESHTGHRIWPGLLGLAAMLTGLLTLMRYGVCRPYEQLAGQLDTVRMRRRAASLLELPVNRRDEIGRIARCIHEVGMQAVHHTAEARQLRRTMDQRIKVATQRACGQLEQLVMRDPLTDLGNRRFLDEQLMPLIESMRSGDEDLACMMIDLDDFKNVNDALGHTAGDNVLVFLAGLIRGLIRRQDYAVRMGGDEFAVFMPGCSPQHARKLAEQLSALFRQHVRTILPADLSCDLSIGIASLRADLPADHPAPGQALFELADHRLYAAKRGGKGRVVDTPTSEPMRSTTV